MVELKMMYKYISIIKTFDLGNKLIKDKHIVYGKKKTEQGYVKPFLIGIHKVLDIIKLPYLMSQDEITMWCKENKTFLKLKFKEIDGVEK